MRSGHLAVCALLAGLVVPASLRADPVVEAAQTLPVEIVHLRIGGSWESEDGGSGYHRFIVARTAPESRAARMIVQWIASAGEASGETIVATREISELTETQHELTGFQAEVEAEGTTLHLETVELGTGTVGGITVFLEGPGSYTATPASN
jgi:hypothetical protein